MKLIGLLLVHLLLLTRKSKALGETAPIEVACTTDLDDESTCSAAGSGNSTSFSKAIPSTRVTGDLFVPNSKESAKENDFISGTESTGKTTDGTLDTEIQESFTVEDQNEDPFPTEQSSKDDIRNTSANHKGTADETAEIQKSSDVNSSTTSTKTDNPSRSDFSIDAILDVDYLAENSSRNETMVDVDARDGKKVNGELMNKNPADFQTETYQKDNKRKENLPDALQQNSPLEDLPLEDKKVEGVILANETFRYSVLNGTQYTGELGELDAQRDIILLNDTPVAAKNVTDNPQLEKETISSDDAVSHLQDNEEIVLNNSSDENNTKSIDKGLLAQIEYQNSSNIKSRSFDSKPPSDMALMSEERAKYNEEKTSKENTTPLVDDSLELLETTSEQDDVELLTDVPLEETLVRKCCEDHQFFSLQTQQCEDARDDPDFINFVQHIILVNSTKHLRTVTGRLSLCPGTTEPPLVSEAAYDVHTLEAFGHISDDVYRVRYDHDHYCLELAAQSPDYLQAATLVLAHCLPTIDDTQAEATVVKTSVRKCCGEREFFSIRSQECEFAGGDPGFLDAIRERLLSEKSVTDLHPNTGLLQECPGSGEPPLIKESDSSSHTLLSSGHLKDHYSTITYNHEHYCLELVASSRDQLADAPITLAYCLPHKKESYRAPPTETVVRKCCANNEYFSTKTQECEPTDNETGFEDYVRGLQIDNSTTTLSYKNGKVHWCASSNDLPNIVGIQSHTHALLAFGHLKDLKSGIKYDHDSYCLELATDSSDNLHNAVFIAAYCPIFNAQILTKKCCNLKQYYDLNSSDCYDRLSNMSNYNNLISDFLSSDLMSTSTSVTIGRLKCKNGPAKAVYADETYLDKTGQLCEHTSGICHSSSAYCIEHFKDEDDEKLKSGAFICPTDVFYKCCPPNEILTDSGCISAGPGYVISSHINQLMQIMLPHFGFQTVGDDMCQTNMINSKTKDVRWWVNKAGYLSLRTKHGKTTNKHYCVDDYLDSENETDTVVVMCLKDVEHILPVEMFAQYNGVPTVGKCCQHEHYLKDNVCVRDNLGLDLVKDPDFVSANITEVVFTSFPICQKNIGFHKYPVGHRTTEDFAIFDSNKEMVIVSLENGCTISQQTVRNKAYCIDYESRLDKIEPVILVCPDIWDGYLRYQEKHSLTAVLLGISCTALTATAFTLISMRVRRGLVTVKKVNTLAGRILLSYVLSYLLAFLLLAIGMKMKTEVGHSCSVLAGFLMFFLLAAFQWNTSICLESLLLTLRVSTSERRRYICHSLWAWGMPGVITTIALTLDYHKDSLPCSVIIPRIGLYHCFFSDKNAQILYLYLPMFVSLCANMILLSAARYVRSAKLRRLEKGGGRPRNTVATGEATEMQDQQSKSGDQNTTSQASQVQTNGQHSGLRTHQTRNLWTESMKLVIWSGATWMAEVTSFLVSRFVDIDESWYNYLWYLPSSINSLRGVGIFVILVLTPENRHKIFKVVGSHFGSWAGSGSLARQSRSGDGYSTSGNHQSMMPQGRSSDSRVAGRRNMSIATTLTQLSSIRGGDANEQSRPDAGTVKVHPRVAHSVSQIDTRRGSASSQSSDRSDGEGSEHESELGAGGRRKSSLANFNLVSLPSVDEEDVFEGASISTSDV